MTESAKDILKEALSEQMEAEANAVPPVEEIRTEHTFSKSFLDKMRVLRDKQEEKEKKEHRVLSGFSEKLANRTARRVLAACLVCVILLGVGALGYQGLLRAGSSGSSDSASSSSAMMAMDEAEEETVEAADAAADGGLETDEADGGGNASDSADAAGNEADYEGAYMAVENVTDHSLTLHMVNSTGEELSYGEFYKIESYDEETDNWLVLETAQDVGFDDTAYIISSGEEITQEVDWTDLYGSLTEGTYRIMKEVQSETNGNFYSLTTEFTVDKK